MIASSLFPKMSIARLPTTLISGALLLVATSAQPQNSQPTGADSSQVFEIGGDVIGPIVTHTAKYDPKDGANHPVRPQTPVVIGIVVGQKGNPESIRVVRSSGVKEADAAAVEAVSQFRFKPAKEHGLAVSVNLYVELIPHSAPLFSPKWESSAHTIEPPVVLHSAMPEFSDETIGFVQPKTKTTLIKLTVDQSGAPTSLTVARSSGNPSFDRSALDAVAKYRFKPALEDNKPVPVELNIEVTFDHIYK